MTLTKLIPPLVISVILMHLQWNVADYFNQNRDKLLCNSNSDLNKQNVGQSAHDEVTSDNNPSKGTTDHQELVYPDFPGVITLAEMSEFDKLWMCLFTKLGEYNMQYIIVKVTYMV